MNDTEIRLLAADIELGHTDTVLCPVCNGGRSQEKSLSITVDLDSSVLYNCYRASCGVKGFIRGTKNNGFIKSTKKIKPPKQPRKVITQNLTEKQLESIYEKYKIKNPEDWYYTPSYGGRIAMSVRSPKYTHRGWCLRDLGGYQKPKVLTFIDPGEEGMSWYRNHTDGPTLVVEDIPSALRAAKYVNVVALLGTGIGQDRAIEIEKYATGPIYMALDQDATALSFKWAVKYGLLWGDARVLPLKQDIKDMEEDDLCQLMKSCTE